MYTDNTFRIRYPNGGSMICCADRLLYLSLRDARKIFKYAFRYCDNDLLAANYENLAEAADGIEAAKEEAETKRDKAKHERAQQLFSEFCAGYSALTA